MNWLKSRRGTLCMSALGLLGFVAYTFLVARYVLEEVTPGLGVAAVETVVVVVIVGIWVYGLLIAWEGQRKGLWMLLGTALLPVMFSGYDLLYYSPIEAGWPVLQTVVWITFLTCAAATVLTILQLRR